MMLASPTRYSWMRRGNTLLLAMCLPHEPTPFSAQASPQCAGAVKYSGDITQYHRRKFISPCSPRRMMLSPSSIQWKRWQRLHVKYTCLLEATLSSFMCAGTVPRVEIAPLTRILPLPHTYDLNPLLSPWAGWSVYISPYRPPSQNIFFAPICNNTRSLRAVKGKHGFT